jgi:hypothetical protein
VYGSFRPEKKIIATRDALEQTPFNDSNHNRLLWEKELEKDESLFMSLKLLRPNRGYKPNSKLNIGYLGKYYTNNKNDTHTDFVINKSSRDLHKFQEKSGHWRTKTCKKASSPILKRMMSSPYPKKNLNEIYIRFFFYVNSTRLSKEKCRLVATRWRNCY